MKLLMVHGSRQSGELLRAKSQAMQKLIRQVLAPLQPGSVEFYYPTAPFALEPSGPSSKLRDQHGQWAWWQSEYIDGVYPGLETGLETLAAVIKDAGPFDGAIGFSQGAAIAAMVASLLEENRRDAFPVSKMEGGFAYPAAFSTLSHPPLKFVISISGYSATHQAYCPFYHPQICTPMLHILGSADTVVEESASMKLVERCQGEEEGIAPLVVHHPETFRSQSTIRERFPPYQGETME
ncbi:alpha/beta hydrolase [Aspergillus candidus]|uniref:Serine hydrolase FSH n=1 Tax=Aspergillus candidus TaxID=41067 RepID=A0A2I2F0V7_ASPCN|nr:serine hydrolase FSH [Aspergillus candidus]PLB34259.1 serine hydrolase FSH [Aspergillus candidus]